MQSIAWESGWFPTDCSLVADVAPVDEELPLLEDVEADAFGPTCPRFILAPERISSTVRLERFYAHLIGWGG